MAVTVEGTFLLIDRASQTLRRIERQAQQTDRALQQLGENLDAIGDRSTQRNLSQTGDAMRKVRGETTTLSRDSDRLSRSFKSLDRDSGGLVRKITDIGAAFAGAARIIKAGFMPAMVAALGIAGQGIADLAGGVVALLPKIADLGGTAAAAATPIAGLVGTMVTFKLALTDVGEAMEADRQEFRKFSPEVQAFATRLKGLRGEVKELKAAAQEGLFPGLNQALTSVTQGRVQRAAQGQLRGFGRAAGGGIAGLARDFTSRGDLKDITRILDDGQRSVGRFFVALRNIGHAFLDILVAARPFTNWLEKTILGWTEGWKQAARLGRATGDLEDYFNRTRDALERFGSIAKNVWDMIQGLFDASRQAGDSLWRSFDRATEAGARWVNSFEGQTWLRDWFKDVADNVRALGDLVNSLGREFAMLGGQSGLQRTARTLQRFMPDLRELLNNMANIFGPGLAELLGQVVRLFNQLSGESGSLTMVVRLLSTMLDILNTLLEKIPALGAVLAAALTVFSVRRMVTWVGELARRWAGVAASASAAAAAQRAATLGGGMPLPMPGRRLPGGRVPGAPGGPMPLPVPLPGRLPLGAPALGGTFRSRYAGARGLGAGRLGALGTALGRQPGGGWISPVAGGVGSTVGSAGSKLGGMALGGLKAAGRFAAPVAALFAAMDFIGTEGNVADKTRGALSGATFGLIPKAATEAEERATGQAGAESFIKTLGPMKNLPQATANLAALREERARIKEEAGHDDFIEDVFGGHDEEYKAQAVAIGKTIDQLQRLRKERITAREVGRAREFDFGGEFRARRQGPGGIAAAFTGTTKSVMDEMRGMGDEGKLILSQNYLQWARTMKRENPKLRDEIGNVGDAIEERWAKMGRTVRVINGNILTGTTKEWKNIRQALTDNAEQARQEVSRAFTDLQREAVGSLIAMGYDRSGAKSIVRGMERGQTAEASTIRVEAARARSGQAGATGATPGGGSRTGGATGMRIPGTGLQDNVPLVMGMAAPGELIVNRHTEQRINRKLSVYGTTLGREVETEGKPHSTSMGRPHALGGRLPTFRFGGNTGPGMGGGGRGGVQGIVALGTQLRNQGFTVTGNAALGSPPTPGAHSATSYHYSGQAIDVNADSMAGGEERNLTRLYNRLARASGLLELFYRNRGIPSPVPDHYDHLHVALGGGGAVPGGASAGMGAAPIDPLRLAGRRSRLGGIPGAMANAGMEAIRKGMEDRINKKIGAGAGIGAGAQTGGGLISWLTQALRITGHFSPANLAALKGRAMQESGGDPNAQNNWDSNAAAGTPSIGLLQTIGPTFDAYKMPGMGNIRNPVHNAVAAIRYMFARYGHIVGPSSGGYATGGRIPWFGNGADFVATGPQMIGVGDGGRERVNISRGGQGGGGGGVSISVGNINVTNNRKGDINREIEQALIRAARRIESQPLEAAEEAMA